MTQWIKIVPQRGIKASVTGRVSFSLQAARGADGSALTRLNVSRLVIGTLGWEPKMLMQVEHTPTGDQLRIAPETQGTDGYSLAIRGTTGTLQFRLPWMLGRREGHDAETVTFRAVPDERALILDVPPWARIPGPPLGADEAERLAIEEGKDLLRSGASVRDVAARLGEDMETVRRWKDQVEAEQGAAA